MHSLSFVNEIWILIRKPTPVNVFKLASMDREKYLAANCLNQTRQVVWSLGRTSSSSFSRAWFSFLLHVLRQERVSKPLPPVSWCQHFLKGQKKSPLDNLRCRGSDIKWFTVRWSQIAKTWWTGDKKVSLGSTSGGGQVCGEGRCRLSWQPPQGSHWKWMNKRLDLVWTLPKTLGRNLQEHGFQLPSGLTLKSSLGPQSKGAFCE